jgi:hypothetical protein
MIAQRDVGLEHWNGFWFSTAVMVKQENRETLLMEPASKLFYANYQEEIRRRRIVHINPIFTGRNFAVDPKLCFVLMPFKNDLRPVYDDHIRKVVTSLQLESKRADDIFRNTAIIEDIWESINRARVIIADLTEKNPNVFYEVGVAHTVGKDVILITQNLEDVPFDLRHLRHVQYQYTPRGMEMFEQQLKNTLVSILGGQPG